MELKINYEYTYFIYPFAVKQSNYKKYIINLIKDKKYILKFFDTFKNIDLYNYFTPNIRKNIFQDFTFTKEKLNAFSRISNSNKYKIILEQDCIMFEYKLEDDLPGKINEKDGIFFKIVNIELVCFKTGICFLLIKTNLEETDRFSDLLNFNYKFANINLENKDLKKIDKIKIQTNTFDNMEEITQIIENVTGKRINAKEFDIDDNTFLTYSYVCIDSNNWNKEVDFENIENEFLKLSTISPSSTNLNIDYDKLNIISNSIYMKLRINNKGSFAICSSTDVNNYTKLPSLYENQYLYTYLIAIHQRYYLKLLSKEYDKRYSKLVSEKFINFTKKIWVNEVTTEDLGQKIYKRCKEKLNLNELYQEVKSKYDIYYKQEKINKNIKQNKIIVLLIALSVIFGMANLVSWIFVYSI